MTSTSSSLKVIAIYAQYKFGIFTMAFFITLVVSYIFKDRIKEVVRDYLSSKLLRFFYIRYTAHDESYLKRFRIVMDRGGIRRLEEIETPV